MASRMAGGAPAVLSLAKFMGMTGFYAPQHHREAAAWSTVDGTDAQTCQPQEPVRRNGIAPRGGPWSSKAGRQAQTATKSLANPESGDGGPLFPWQNFGMVS